MRSTKHIAKFLVVFSPLFLLGFRTGEEKEMVFPGKAYKSFSFFFDSKQEMIDFFDFKKGETVADIGAGDGTYEGVMSLWTDSLTIYAEDILPPNQRKFDKLMKRVAAVKGTAISNKFVLSRGNEKSTLLPDGIFDKIIMISALHEFGFKDEMITDIRQKLKPGGKVYILETHCYTTTHVNVAVDEIKNLMTSHRFKLLKEQRPKTELTHLFVFEKE